MKNPCPTCRKQNKCVGKCSKRGKYDDERNELNILFYHDHHIARQKTRKPNKI